MAAQTLETRLATTENELLELRREMASRTAQTRPASWERIFGSFANSEGFEKATRLGREYREAQNTFEENEEA